MPHLDGAGFKSVEPTTAMVAFSLGFSVNVVYL